MLKTLLILVSFLYATVLFANPPQQLSQNEAVFPTAPNTVTPSPRVVTEPNTPFQIYNTQKPNPTAGDPCHDMFMMLSQTKSISIDTLKAMLPKYNASVKFEKIYTWSLPNTQGNVPGGAIQPASRDFTLSFSSDGKVTGGGILAANSPPNEVQFVEAGKNQTLTLEQATQLMGHPPGLMRYVYTVTLPNNQQLMINTDATGLITNSSCPQSNP